MRFIMSETFIMRLGEGALGFWRGSLCTENAHNEAHYESDYELFPFIMRINRQNLIMNVSLIIASL